MGRGSPLAVLAGCSLLALTTWGSCSSSSSSGRDGGNPYDGSAQPDALSPSEGVAPLTELTELTIPTLLSVPTSIALGSDGNLWFTENASDKVAKITPSGAITEYPVPPIRQNAAADRPGRDSQRPRRESLVRREYREPDRLHHRGRCDQPIPAGEP